MAQALRLTLPLAGALLLTAACMGPLWSWLCGATGEQSLGRQRYGLAKWPGDGANAYVVVPRLADGGLKKGEVAQSRA